MKLFHLGDLHIGKTVNGFSMLEDQKYVLEQLYQLVEQEQPDVVILAGDVFDRSVPGVEAVAVADALFSRIAIELHTPMIVIAGNHDSNERIGYLSPFAKQHQLYLRGVLTAEITPIYLEDGDGMVAFYPIPYAKPAVIREVYADPTISNHDDGMRAILAGIQAQIQARKNQEAADATLPRMRHVAIAHGHVAKFSATGAEPLEESRSEKPLEIGGTDVVDAKYFDIFDYTALGHLHGPQKVGTDHMRYSGSLLPYSFSEVKQKKGLTIIELDGTGQVEVTYRPFQLRRKMRILRGALQDLLEPGQEQAEGHNDYLRVELTDKGAILDPMSKLRSVYPYVMELARVENQHTMQKNRVSTLGKVKEQDPLQLVEEFYQYVLGTSCEEDKLAWIQTAMVQVTGKEDES